MPTMANLKLGIIGGSGLGEALAAEAGGASATDTSGGGDTPFGPPSSPITNINWQGVEVHTLQRHGPGHTLNPSQVPYRANIYALKKLGVTHIIASGATGSLREEIAPGDLVIIDQAIDKTCKRPNTFYEHAAVHVELADPFCPIMRDWLLAAAKQLPDVRVHTTGCYVCMEGPAFSTRAESHMHRAWGGDLIGMTLFPEARLAREAEIAYAMIAMPTDYDCWRPHDPNKPQQELLAEIIANLKTATQRNLSLIKQALRDTTALQTPSPAHQALNLAVWSDKQKIDPAQIKNLKTLWGRCFE